METPLEDVLAALVLDTKLDLRFVRTRRRAEGARVALATWRGWSVVDATWASRSGGTRSD